MLKESVDEDYEGRKAGEEAMWTHDGAKIKRSLFAGTAGRADLASHIKSRQQHLPRLHPPHHDGL